LHNAVVPESPPGDIRDLDTRVADSLRAERGAATSKVGEASYRFVRKWFDHDGLSRSRISPAGDSGTTAVFRDSHCRCAWPASYVKFINRSEKARFGNFIGSLEKMRDLAERFGKSLLKGQSAAAPLFSLD